MSAQKGKTPSLKKFVLVLILVAIGGFLVWYFKFRSPDLAKPSEDQQELVNEFGYPDTFTLTMMDDVRYETWNYYELEQSFMFLNGSFIENVTIENVTDDFQFPDFKPTQFKENMTLGDVRKFLGDPTIEGEISSELLENAKIYDFWDQVKVGTKEEKIVYVETLPVYIPEEFRVKDEKK